MTLSTWWANIDWEASGLWMQAWAGLAGAVAVVTAAKIGAARFGDWLKEKQTERQMNAAERALDVAYRVRGAFESIRNPGYDPGGEGGAALAKLHSNIPDFDGLEDDRQARLTWAQVILSRISGANAEWTALFEAMPLAKAYFPAGVEQALRDLWKQRAVVWVAAQQYGSTALPPDVREKLETKMWGVGAEDDEVVAAVEDAVKRLETVLLPILRSELDG